MSKVLLMSTTMSQDSSSLMCFLWLFSACCSQIDCTRPNQKQLARRAGPRRERASNVLNQSSRGLRLFPHSPNSKPDLVRPTFSSYTHHLTRQDCDLQPTGAQPTSERNFSPRPKGRPSFCSSTHALKHAFTFVTARSTSRSIPYSPLGVFPLSSSSCFSTVVVFVHIA